MDLSFLPEEIREKAFVTKDGMLFLPEGDLTGEESYKKWLESKDKQIDICPTKTTEEKLEELMKEYNDLKSRTSNIEETIMGIMTEI